MSINGNINKPCLLEQNKLRPEVKTKRFKAHCGQAYWPWLEACLRARRTDTWFFLSFFLSSRTVFDDYDLQLLSKTSQSRSENVRGNGCKTLKTFPGTPQRKSEKCLDLSLWPKQRNATEILLHGTSSEMRCAVTTYSRTKQHMNIFLPTACQVGWFSNRLLQTLGVGGWSLILSAWGVELFITSHLWHNITPNITQKP